MKNQKRIQVLILGQIILAIFLFSSSSFAESNRSNEGISLRVLDLKCEYINNPLGTDVKKPQLSWRIEASKRGVKQVAYQIWAAESLENLEEGQPKIWDSGKIESSKSVGTIYGGPRLESRQKVFWKIKIWDNAGNEAVSNELAWFEMGLLHEEDWKARWIGMTPGWNGKALYFRKEVLVEKVIKRARLYVSGIGYNKVTINGIHLGDNVLDPGATDYSKQVLYTTYDVTQKFQQGENAIGVVVGSGWYGIPKLLLQVEIFYTDGTIETIKTGNEPFIGIWTVSTGPIIQNSIYDGEVYDARLERSCWEMPGYKNIDSTPNRLSGWVMANIVDPPGGKLVAQKMEPIKVVDSFVPKSIKEPKPGIFVIDAGQNLAGWASLKVKGESGIAVSLKFAETLNADGTVNQANLRAAKAKDTYILKGDGEEQWEPSFTYHGFRYIQIEGFPGQPLIENFRIKVVRSSVDRSGQFKCSNELLNSIHRMVWSTEASNLHSIPTDCPQRNERMGWLNDMTVRIEQALYNFSLPSFYNKWILDIGDTQNSEGAIADTAPFKWGSQPADPVSSSYLLLAWMSYQYYGNTQIIEDNYDKMKAWVDYLASRTEDGIVNYSYYGDWSPPMKFGTPGSIGSGAVSKFTPGKLMSTGYLYYDAKLIAQMATILDKEEDARKYNMLSEQTKTAFNQNYWDEKLGGYGTNNQAANSFALFLGIELQGQKSRIAANLVQDVIANDYHLTTGNLCTKYLLEMLTENGQSEVAYKIVTQTTYPSWGYMLDNGATTLWERWENKTGGEMNSHNHPMMGSVDTWFYKYLSGIRPDAQGPGFNEFIIRPYIINELDFVEGEFQSVKGLIKSAWRKESGSVSMDVTIPGNSTATVFIPTKNRKSITEGNQAIDHLKELKFLRMEEKYAVFEVGSGTYHFKSDW
ncbi:MAG TPA: family 78 glycoside hydrolase catalytic domain [Prolixibacteraceae bacterium]|nr:family 78 glycoside hydrolase catalytic domain [Prolixibacteraceae bacterium]